MGSPRKITEEQVKAAGEGRSEEILGDQKPLELSEDEVKAASKGKSEEVMYSKKSRK
jgi:hypothetical protein